MIDDGMASGGFLGIFMTRKVRGSLSKVSHHSTNLTKMIAETKIIYGKTAKTLFLHKGIEGHL